MTKDRYLFRGFHKEENGKETIYIDNFPIKGKWVEGYYSKTDLGMFINQYIVDYEDECTYCEDFEVIPETIGQCVGLSDKNGRLIFENDVIKCHYANAIKDTYIEQVVFYKGKFMAYGKIDGTEHWAYLYDDTHRLVIDKSVYMDDMEVIGTIFDKEVNDNE